MILGAKHLTTEINPSGAKDRERKVKDGGRERITENEGMEREREREDDSESEVVFYKEPEKY